MPSMGIGRRYNSALSWRQSLKWRTERWMERLGFGYGWLTEFETNSVFEYSLGRTNPVAWILGWVLLWDWPEWATDCRRAVRVY